MKKHIILLSAIALFGFFSCNQPQSESTSNDVAPAQSTEREFEKGQSAVKDASALPNILQIAINSPDHTTLVAAVQAAGIEDVLVNAGPLTVFAPTNEAFDKLPEGVVEDLLKPENKEKLAFILQGHAAPGKLPTKFLKDGNTVYMANGEYVPIEVKDGEYYVGGAMIIASVEATNGIVHVVDAVILPQEK